MTATAIDWTAILPPWLPEALPAGILLTDADLVIRHWCARLERATGFTASQLLGRPLLEFFPDLRERGFERVFRRALAGERVSLPAAEHPYLLAPPGQGEPAHLLSQRVVVCPLSIGGEVVGTVATFLDSAGETAEEVCAARAEAEEARAAQAAAEEALRQRDSYLSLAAHELRTPLTALLGRAQLLQRWLGDEGSAEERTVRSARIVVEQARRLNGMITNLLEVSRIQTGRLKLERQQLDLAPLIRQVAEEQGRVAERRVELAIEADRLPALADKARLEQVLRSLVDNAVKYSPAGGAIIVRAGRRGPEAWVSVADQGIGIPTDDQPQLFRGQFRASNAERLGIKGLGIELFVAARVLELHSGRIGVESREGYGSIFTVRLPLSGGEL